MKSPTSSVGFIDPEGILNGSTQNERIRNTTTITGKKARAMSTTIGSDSPALRLVRATRPRDETSPDFVKKLVDWGAGPRAGQFLIQGGKAFAAMEGRFSVAVDDIKKAAIPVLRHRISTNFQAQAEGKTSEDVITQLLKVIEDPDIAKYEKRKK